MGKYILQVRVEKQDRSSLSKTLGTCASNAITQGNVASPHANIFE
jgi:hypothetical protein